MRKNMHSYDQICKVHYSASDCSENSLTLREEV
jgi:hypothetical protein